MSGNEKAMSEEICGCYSKQNFYRLREATNKARQSLRDSRSVQAEVNFGYAVAEEARFFEGWTHVAQRQAGNRGDEWRELIAVKELNLLNSTRP